MSVLFFCVANVHLCQFWPLHCSFELSGFLRIKVSYFFKWLVRLTLLGCDPFSPTVMHKSSDTYFFQEYVYGSSRVGRQDKKDRRSGSFYSSSWVDKKRQSGWKETFRKLQDINSSALKITGIRNTLSMASGSNIVNKPTPGQKRKEIIMPRSLPFKKRRRNGLQCNRYFPC